MWPPYTKKERRKKMLSLTDSVHIIIALITQRVLNVLLMPVHLDMTNN